MPLFTRRRLQAMLNELGDELQGKKGRDLLGRLEDKRVDQVLPAEMELALLWSLNSLGDLEIEPDWWGDDRRPDGVTEALIPRHPVAIEIAAPNDNEISGEEAMDKVAMEIAGCANRAKKGVGAYLFFRFNEESGYKQGRYFRRRTVPAKYAISPAAEAAVSSWIKSGSSRLRRLRIVEAALQVEVEHTEYRQTRYHNIWSSMPPETHSLTENPLFDLLVRKTGQLKAASPGTIRLIFLADVGSSLLNRLGTVGELDSTRRRVSGREIISHFVETKAHRVDGVVVFAPRRERSLMGQSSLQWAVTIFTHRSEVLDARDSFTQIAARLPKPRFEGGRVPSLQRRGGGIWGRQSRAT